MNEDFSTDSQLEVISGFLRHFDQPAVGHARGELSATEKSRIEALARGELGPAERQELLPVLSSNDHALEYLARLAKGESSS